MQPMTDSGVRQRSDDTLVLLVRSGDARASEALVRRHGGRLLWMARRLLGREEDARRAVRDGFLEALGSSPVPPSSESVALWLKRHLMRAAAARLAKEPATDISHLLPRFDETEHAEPPPGPVRDLLASRDEERYAEALASLPACMRAPILLRDSDEVSTAELASVLSVPEAEAETLAHRARQALVTLLGLTRRTTA
jgi:RNA polymerase sigma-70 factor (ECF subfamily)